MLNKSLKLAVLYGISGLAIGVCACYAGEQLKISQTEHYAYATKGIWERASSSDVRSWRLLLDESNLGGKELEMSELVLPAGAIVGSHHHGAVEVLYVISGTLGHEVNGEMHMLTPGMVGVVRPEDSVRHIVPKESDVKLLVIWAPAGEARHFFNHTTGTPIEQK